MKDTDISSIKTEDESQLREFKGTFGKVVRIGAILFCLYNLLYLLGFLETKWIFINEEEHLPIVLGMMLIFSFLFFPARKKWTKDNRLQWHDFIFIGVSLVGTIYISINATEIILTSFGPTLLELVLGTMTIIAVLEATRRTMGWPVIIIVLIAIFYCLYTDLFPGIFWGPRSSWSEIVAHSWLFPTGMFSLIMKVIATYAFIFLTFGMFISVLGAGTFFLDSSLALAGRFAGGPAKVAVIGSGLFGMISGSPTSNIVTTGVITIPLMKRIGYEPVYAGAIETAASTGGMLMPPIMGTTAFIMADFMQVPYIDIAIAAFLPGMLYYIALFVQAHLQAKKRGMIGLSREELPSMVKVLKSGWHFLVPMAVLIYFLAVLRYSPITCCLYAIGALLLVAIFRKESRWNLKTIGEVFYQTIRLLTRIFPIAAAIGILIGCVEVTGLPLTLSSMLLKLSHGNIFFLLVLTGAACYIFGMGLPSMVAYLMMAILVAPALTKAGIPMMAAHLFIFYFAITHVITPPVCEGAWMAAIIAGGPMMGTGFQAMRLGILVFIVPFAFVYNPALLLKGSLLEILLAVAFSIIGAISIGIGLEGYLIKRVNWLGRLLFLVGGFAVFFPIGMMKIAGGMAIVMAVVLEGLSFQSNRYVVRQSSN